MAEVDFNDLVYQHARVDIAAMLPYLAQEAEKASIIVEVGSANGNGSTRAFWFGLRKSNKPNKLMISVDIERSMYPECMPTESWWHYVIGDSSSQDTVAEVLSLLDGRKIDILLIDSLHEADHVRKEVVLWMPLCHEHTLRLFHDTSSEIFKEYGEAVREYAASNGFVYEDIVVNNYGLGKISKQKINCRSVALENGAVASVRTDMNVTNNINATAVFAINEYALTYAASPNGYVGGVKRQKVNHGGCGSEVAAYPNPGYSFTGWSDGVKTPSRIDANVTKDVDAVAMFAIDEYAVVRRGR